MKNKILIIILIFSLFFLSFAILQKQKIKTISLNKEQILGEKKESSMNDTTTQIKKLNRPGMLIDTNKTYTAVLHTNRGDIKISLDTKDTPIATNNFVYLARQKFYDKTIFHRIINNFMIQGGDPLGTGTGGPGYTFADEQSSQKLVTGSLAMANRGSNTNGSQFFIITAEATPWLDGKHTNFGKVIEGMEVVNAISKAQTGAKDKPIEDIVINSVEIIES